MTSTPATTPRPVTARPVTPLGILAATLAEVVDGLADAAPDVRAKAAYALELARGLDPYLDACATPESPALAALAQDTRAQPWAADGPLEQEMLSGHVEGQVLKMLVALTGARRVLDVGMFTGYSALAMAEALPADGHVVACEIDPDVAAIARRHFDATPDGAKIGIELGPARETLRRLAAAAPGSTWCSSTPTSPPTSTTSPRCSTAGCSPRVG